MKNKVITPSKMPPLDVPPGADRPPPPSCATEGNESQKHSLTISFNFFNPLPPLSIKPCSVKEML